MSNVPPSEPTEAVPADGGPLYCRNCGTELEPGAQFCSKCGAATHAGGAEPTMVTPVVEREPVRRTTVVDEDPVYEEPMTVVRSGDNWWSGPFIFMAAAILVVLIVVLAVALSRDGEPPATTLVPVTTLPPATTVVPAPVIVPPPGGHSRTGPDGSAADCAAPDRSSANVAAADCAAADHHHLHHHPAGLALRLPGGPA
jgi:hypothetical protein